MEQISDEKTDDTDNNEKNNKNLLNINNTKKLNLKNSSKKKIEDKPEQINIDKNGNLSPIKKALLKVFIVNLELIFYF